MLELFVILRQEEILLFMPIYFHLWCLSNQRFLFISVKVNQGHSFSFLRHKWMFSKWDNLFRILKKSACLCFVFICIFYTRVGKNVNPLHLRSSKLLESHKSLRYYGLGFTLDSNIRGLKQISYTAEAGKALQNDIIQKWCSSRSSCLFPRAPLIS